MPYITKWLVPYRVLLTYHYGVSTAEEVQQNMNEMPAYMNEGIPFIHYIADGRDVTKNEFTMNDLKAIFGASSKDVRMGWTCSINASSIQRFFSALIFQFSGARGRGFSTVDEALRFLAASDDTIPTYEDMAQAYAELQATLAEMVSQPQ